MRTQRPTIQDVARLAGVSGSTVSLVINNKTGGNVRISEETRRKVWEAVKQLNYHPMSAARTLRTKHYNLLALMIPHFETPFQAHFVAAVQNQAEKKGLDIFVYGTRDEARHEQNFINVLLSRGVDGVIIHSHHLTSADLDPLVNAGIAVVISGNSPSHTYADNIHIDETGSAREMVSYLLQKGHRRIGLISGSESTWSGRLRKEGYLSALSAYGLSPDPDLIQYGDYYRLGSGEAAARHLLSLPDRPTAIFCASDTFAVEAIQYAHDIGLRVPDDLAVAGFDDTREAVRVRPKLTTVHKDVGLMASAIMRLMEDRIHSSELLPARQIRLDYQIIYRDSA